MAIDRGVVLAAVLVLSVISVLPASATPASGTGLRNAGLTAATPVAESLSAAVEGRLRVIVALTDLTRARAAAPGLRDEERDALAELAWSQMDDALEDPMLRERARRDPDFLQAQALLLMDEGEDEQAVAVLERLRTIAPEDPQTHRLLALGLTGLGRTQAAVESFRRALDLGVGDEADVRAHLAFALAAAGRREEGLAECERAIAADPATYLGHFVRGWIFGELGRREEERREYLAAVQRERDDADLWAMLAESWERAGDGVRAKEAWREVVRIDPSDETAAEKLAQPGPIRSP